MSEDLKDFYAKRLAKSVHLEDVFTFKDGYNKITRYSVVVDRDKPDIERELMLSGQRPDLSALLIDITHTGIGDRCDHIAYLYTNGKQFSLSATTLMVDDTERRFIYTPYVVNFIGGSYRRNND